MPETLPRTLVAAALLLATAGVGAAQTTTPPPTQGTTSQTVTFRSSLNSLQNLTPGTLDRSATGDAITTMRLERDSTGKLVRAVVLVQLTSDTSQPETFNQIRFGGNTGGTIATFPITNSQATVPGQTYRVSSQQIITDPAQLAQIEQMLMNPSSYSVTFNTASNPNGFFMGAFRPDQDTVMSRSEARERALGKVNQTMYRLIVLMAFRDGIITQAERDTLLQDLTTYMNALAQADNLGSGLPSNQGGTGGTPTTPGTPTNPGTPTTPGTPSTPSTNP